MADRAVSVVVHYVVVLAVVAILGSGLFVSAGSFVGDQEEIATRTQLEVVGNRLAADVAEVDRQSRSVETNGSIRGTSELPEAVTGTGYWIDVTSGDGADRYVLVLRTTDPEVRVEVGVRSRTAVALGTVSGGPLTLSVSVADGVAEPIEVSDD